MRRVTISVVLSTALAVPVSATALGGTLYSGHPVSVFLKGEHIKKVNTVSFDTGLPLKCDEGTTSFDSPVVNPKSERPRLKHRKFNIEFVVEPVFEVIDDGGYPVSRTKGKFAIAVKGRFNKSYRKASGTLRMTGDWFGAKSANGFYDLQYHNCDSGIVDWIVHK